MEPVRLVIKQVKIYGHVECKVDAVWAEHNNDAG